jgi:hypothetical protein
MKQALVLDRDELHALRIGKRLLLTFNNGHEVYIEMDLSGPKLTKAGHNAIMKNLAKAHKAPYKMTPARRKMIMKNLAKAHLARKKKNNAKS